MALKFRRGTTAQQSGSLQFGEPFVNSTLGTLVIGGPNGDIVLSAGGTGSTGNFGPISGSGLDITGNAKIEGNLTLGGNITIGDNTSDSVNVVASLSSSLIPSVDNAFDLGSETKMWRDLYISTASIKMVDPTTNQVVTTISGIAGGGIQIGNIQITTGSINVVDNNGNVTQQVANSSSAGVAQIYATTGSFNDYTQSANTNITTNSASAAGAFASASAYSASAATALNTLSSSYATTGSNVFVGDQTITGSLAIKDSETNFLIEGNGFSQTYLTSNGAIVLNPGYGGVEMVGSYRTFKATDITADGFVSASTITGLGNATLYSQSVVSAISASDFGQTLLSASIATTNNTQTDNITTATQAAAGAFASASAYSGSAVTTYAKLSGDNIFNGTQTITGSLFVSSNLVVQGSSSLQNITASAVSIGTNKIILNNDSPAVRYAGIAVFDSGSTNVTASLLYDSLTNNWKFEHTDTGTDDASIVLFGPLGTGIDNAPTLAGNFLTKVENNGHGHHLTTSSIQDTGTLVKVVSATQITGSLGVSGSIGVIGNLTINGTSYAAASSGTSGAQGPQGTNGTIGTNGAQGPTGGAGPTGPQGRQGPTGPNGGTGPTGPTGNPFGGGTFTGGISVQGAITATGDITAYSSDDRLKVRIGNIENALSKVQQLNGFHYTNSDVAKSLGYTTDEQQVGVSAQEVQEVLPEVVVLAPIDRLVLESGEIISKSGENYLTVKYEKIVPLIIEAIKELKAELDELKNK